MAPVSVLILNYNGREFIEACLRSVYAQDCPLREVLVVDNGSSDGSPEVVKERFPQARLIEAGTNLGFAGGMNLGIRESQGDMLLLLNPDVVLESGYVEGLVEAIADDPSYGSAIGKVYRFPVGERKVIDTTGHVIYKNRLFTDRGEDEVDTGQFNQADDVFGACAGVGLYRREMLEDVKEGDEYFDESFFLFLEDTDLSWRAQLRGWKCRYVPKAVAYHHRGGTAKRRTKVVELNNYKNRYMMLIKNDPFSDMVRHAHHFLLTDSLKTAALLWRCPPALLGWFTVWRELPALIRKRRIIQGNRRISRTEFNRWYVAFDYGRWMRRHIGGA